MTTLVIGIAGGTSSGKTSLASKLLERLEGYDVGIIHHDSYYRDIASFEGLAPHEINFDHPDSLESSLLIEHVKKLKKGKAIEQPIYHFATYKRSSETRQIEPRKILIVEGMLILAVKGLRDLLDIKIFIDTDADERLLRRLKRDITERGQTVESIMSRYLASIKPMHLEFVEPSKRFADVIIPKGSQNHIALDMVAVKIEQMASSTTSRAGE